MISLAPAEVQGVMRTQHTQPRQIQFAFRADPVALDDLGLDPTARALMVLILDNARLRGGRCRLSNGTMGRILRRCPMTISRALGRLQAAGLILRELVAGGRVRTGIVVTWEAAQVQDPGRLTEQCTVRRERLTGSTSAPKGVRRERLTDQSPIQSEISDADRSSLRGDEEYDPASRVASGPEAAAYLRACIESGRKGLQPPTPTLTAEPARATQDEPTAPAQPKAAPVADRPATAKPAASPTTPQREEARPTPRTAVKAPSTTPAAPRTYSPAPCVPTGQAIAMFRRMVNDLAEDVKAPDVGRYRLAPKKLARKLAEVRRKHGFGKAEPRK